MSAPGRRPAWRLAPLLLAGLLLAPSSLPAGSASRLPPAGPPEFDYIPPEPGSYRLPVLRVAADGPVLDETGRAGRLHDVVMGRIAVLAFIYTRCADICPFAMLLLQELHALSAEDARVAGALQLVTVSIDPTNDTPEVMAMHAQAWREVSPAAAPWRFLTTRDEAELAPLLAAFGQPMRRKADPADPAGPISHLLRVFLIDREARIRNIYSLDFLDPRLVLADVRTLLLAEEESSGG